MENIDQSYSFYDKCINLIELKDYKGAINSIKENLGVFNNKDDIALAYLNCGFLYTKLGDYKSSINDFSEAIYHESLLDILNGRSKDLSFSGRSNSRYKLQDYHGAIEDKRIAKKMRLSELEKLSELNNTQIDYKSILLGSFDKSNLETKYNILIKSSRIEKSKYDLIEDYKKVINYDKQEEVMKKLEVRSEIKYKAGDYKASIKAIRRAEKYY